MAKRRAKEPHLRSSSSSCSYASLTSCGCSAAGLHWTANKACRPAMEMQQCKPAVVAHALLCKTICNGPGRRKQGCSCCPCFIVQKHMQWPRLTKASKQASSTRLYSMLNRLCRQSSQKCPIGKPHHAVVADSRGQLLRPEVQPCCCAAQASWSGQTPRLQRFHMPE